MTKTATVFSVLVILAEIGGPLIGIPRGVLAPTTADFGNTEHLLQLSRNHAAAILPWSLALCGSYLALPIALGWYQVLRHTGGLAVLIGWVANPMKLLGLVEARRVPPQALLHRITNARRRSRGFVPDPACP